MSQLKTINIGFVGLCLASGLTGLENRLYAEIYVPRDYATIQAGIDAVEDGDRVLVAAGIYDVNEPITFRGKNITLKSEIGPAQTIIRMQNPINPEERASVFVFENGETNDAILEGFTITGGRSYDEGGGIYCQESSPTIRNNIITENGAGSGGGIACVGGHPLIMSNVISRNEGFSEAGGIYCMNSQAQILDNIIKGNSVRDESGGGIYCGSNSSVIIEGNYIIDNFAREDGAGICLWDAEAIINKNIIFKNKSDEDGGGIQSTYSVVHIMGNTITGNISTHGGGGIDFYHEPDYPFHEGFMRAINNIIWNNGNEILDTGPSEILYNLFSQSDFCGQNGNICADPLLVNPNPDPNTLDSLIETGDFEGAMKYLTRCFSLQQESPCIDAGDPANDDADPDSTVADLGAIYFNQRACNRSDLYHDGFINFSDYARFANNWMRTYPGLEGDIYIDNKGDEKDLEILTENWLHGCED